MTSNFDASDEPRTGAVLVWNGLVARLAGLGLERGQRRDARGDCDDPGGLQSPEPLVEEDVRGDRCHRSELGGEHGADGDSVSCAERVGRHAHDLGETRADDERRRLPGEGHATRDRERDRDYEHAEDTRWEDGPHERKLVPDLRGRVQTRAERESRRTGEEDGSATVRRPHRRRIAGGAREERPRRDDGQGDQVPAARVSPAAIAMIAAIAPSVETTGAITPTFPIRRAE